MSDLNEFNNFKSGFSIAQKSKNNAMHMKSGNNFLPVDAYYNPKSQNVEKQDQLFKSRFPSKKTPSYINDTFAGENISRSIVQKDNYESEHKNHLVKPRNNKTEQGSFKPFVPLKIEQNSETINFKPDIKVAERNRKMEEYKKKKEEEKLKEEEFYRKVNLMRNRNQ